MKPVDVTPSTIAPPLDREQREAVRVHERHVDAADEVVERREDDEREQARRRRGRPRTLPRRSIERTLLALGRRRLLLGDPQEQQVHERRRAVRTIAITSVHPMPSRPIARPLNTLVTMNATPCTVPTRPFAFACRSTGTSSVTVVDSAMLRMFSTTAPNRMMPENSQNHGPPRSSSADSGCSRYSTPAMRNDAERHEAREDHHLVLAVAVDDRAEQHREERDEQHVRAADDAGREHRPRLEVHPEGQREPEEARRDVRDRGVDEHLHEGAHAARRRCHALRRSPGRRVRRRRGGRSCALCSVQPPGHPTRVTNASDIRNPRSHDPHHRARELVPRTAEPRNPSHDGCRAARGIRTVASCSNSTTSPSATASASPSTR